MKRLIALLKKRGIVSEFVAGDPQLTDNEIVIVGHPLGLCIQLTPYSAPDIYQVCHWTDTNKTAMIFNPSKSTFDAVSQVERIIKETNFQKI